MKQIVVPATKFKAECLRLLDEAGAGTRIIVTKRGKPIARVEAAEPPVKSPRGMWAGKVKAIGDIVHYDTSELWEANWK